MRLVWDPSTSPDLVGYLVFRAEGAGAPERTDEGPIADPFFTDDAVAAGQRYRYTVRAVDAAGNQRARRAPRPGQTRVDVATAGSGSKGRPETRKRQDEPAGEVHAAIYEFRSHDPSDPLRQDVRGRERLPPLRGRRERACTEGSGDARAALPARALGRSGRRALSLGGRRAASASTTTTPTAARRTSAPTGRAARRATRSGAARRGDEPVLETGWGAIAARVDGERVTLALPPCRRPEIRCRSPGRDCPRRRSRCTSASRISSSSCGGDLDKLPIEPASGRPLRRHPALPEGDNVNFVRADGPDRIRGPHLGARGRRRDALLRLGRRRLGRRRGRQGLAPSPVVCGTRSGVDLTVDFRPGRTACRRRAPDRRRARDLRRRTSRGGVEGVTAAA